MAREKDGLDIDSFAKAEARNDQTKNSALGGTGYGIDLHGTAKLGIKTPISASKEQAVRKAGQASGRKRSSKANLLNAVQAPAGMPTSVSKAAPGGVKKPFSGF